MGCLTGDWGFHFLDEKADDQAEQYNDELF
jgi:hypothetical protein